VASQPFDTLDFAAKLQAGGFTEPQAKAASEALRAVTSELVTRRDLAVELQLLEQRLVIKVGAMLAAAVVIVGALVALF